MAAANSRKLLSQRAYKQLPQPVQPHLISLCPTLELVAVATTDKQVDVFRFGGQRAFGARSARDKPTVCAICWKFDGSELAVWWSDNMWQTIESNIGHVGPPVAFFCDDMPLVQNIECVAWEGKIIDPFLRSRIAAACQVPTELDSTNSIGSATSEPAEDEEGEEAKSPTIEDLLSFDTFDDSPKTAIDHLPTLLASFTVRDELPRLSALPYISNHGLDSHSESVMNIFTRQELVDAFVNFVGSGVSDVMDFLNVGYGGVHMSIGHGSQKFGLCCMTVPDTIHRHQRYRIIGFASHPSACCQAMLTSAAQPDGVRERSNSSFGIFFSSLNVILKSGHYLPVVNQAVSQLIILDRYITFAIAAIREAWNNARAVFSRYVQSIEETLSERDDTDTKKFDIITALYRLAVTGHCEPAVEEWMKDIMGLKGIERWNVAFPSGMVQVIDLIHGNLLPALDRASVEASRLRAMCRNKKAPICQLSEKTLTQLLDDLDIIRVLGNAALLYARDEIPQIEAFATFIRCQIQILKEPDSSAAKDAVETISGLDYTLLLSFITGPMTRSHLNVFFGREPSMISKSPRRPKQHAGKKIILSMLERHSQHPVQPTTPVVEFTNLLYQSHFLSDTVNEVQDQLRAQFASAAVNAHQIALDWDKISSATDIRMVFQRPPFHDKNGKLLPIQEDESMATYVVAVPEARRDQLRIYRKVHRSALAETDVSPEQIEASTRLFYTHCIAVIPECNIWDVKFVNDACLVLLLSNGENRSFLLQFPVFRFWESPNLPTDDKPETSPLNEPPPHRFINDNRDPVEFRTAQINFSDLGPYILHEFDPPSDSGTFIPRHMHIRGPGRSAKHLFLLDESTTKYIVFDLAGIEWRWG